MSKSLRNLVMEAAKKSGRRKPKPDPFEPVEPDVLTHLRIKHGDPDGEGNIWESKQTPEKIIYDNGNDAHHTYRVIRNPEGKITHIAKKYDTTHWDTSYSH